MIARRRNTQFSLLIRAGAAIVRLVSGFGPVNSKLFSQCTEYITWHLMLDSIPEVSTDSA